MPDPAYLRGLTNRCRQVHQYPEVGGLAQLQVDRVKERLYFGWLCLRKCVARKRANDYENHT